MTIGKKIIDQLNSCDLSHQSLAQTGQELNSSVIFYFVVFDKVPDTDNSQVRQELLNAHHFAVDQLEVVELRLERR